MADRGVTRPARVFRLHEGIHEADQIQVTACRRDSVSIRTVSRPTRRSDTDNLLTYRVILSLKEDDSKQFSVTRRTRAMTPVY